PGEADPGGVAVGLRGQHGHPRPGADDVAAGPRAYAIGAGGDRAPVADESVGRERGDEGVGVGVVDRVDHRPDGCGKVCHLHLRFDVDSQGVSTCAVPTAASGPISSAMRFASSMRVATMSDSGTVLMTWPLTKICPLPLPDATPRSASRASPGPLTTQPMTATRSGTVRPFSPAVTFSASV